MYKKITTPLIGIFLVLCAAASILPFAYMALVSLTQKELLDFHFVVKEFSIINYQRVFKNFNILQNFRNSLIVTGMACILNNLVSSMAAYAFAKKQFPFRDRLFFIYLATLMIPGQVTLIPVFVMIRNLGLMNTYPALFLPIINAFGIFLVRQFLVALPNDLLEAAKIDGCNDLRIFVTIVIPLLKTVLVSLTIFTFITSWNDFLWPLVIAGKPEMKTLTLAVSALKGTYSTNYGLVMAGSTLTFLPPFILFMFLQKMFIEGIALSGIKG